MSGPEASSQQISQQQLVDAVYNQAAQQMRDGVAPAAIEKNLVAQGLDARSAHTVISNLTEARAEAHKKAANKNMLFGALWCIGGTVVTAGTYEMAVPSSGGGHYLVAWGAIVLGAIQFFRGLFQAVAGPS